MWRRSIGLLLLCAPVGAGAQAPAVRDSAGARVVTNERPLLAPAKAWRVDALPQLRIGAGDPRTAGDTLYEFHLAMGVVRISDGGWAVGVQASDAVRFYDARGRFVRSAGRRGKGPGEFEQVMGLRTTRGDTLAVSDLDGIEWYDGTGRFIRPGAGRGRSTVPYVFAWGYFDDGSHVGLSFENTSVPPAGRRVVEHPLVVVSRDGGRSTTIGRFPINEQVFDGKSPYGSNVVYGAAAHLAVASDRIYLTRPSGYAIDVLSREGRLLASFRRPAERVAVTPPLGDAYVKHVRGTMGEDPHAADPRGRELMEASLARATFAEHLPAIGGLIVSRDGTLWVRRYDHRQAMLTPGPVRTQTIAVPTQWDVFDREGRWLTTLTLPARFTPQEIGADYVAGIMRNEDDEEGLLVLRLRKP